jgi:hypothetical protein
MSTHGTEDSAPEPLMLYILLLIGACVIRVMHVRFRPWRRTITLLVYCSLDKIR